MDSFLICNSTVRLLTLEFRQIYSRFLHSRLIGGATMTRTRVQLKRCLRTMIAVGAATISLAYFPPHIFAQGPPTGTPPFGSFGGRPDVINLANLNAHLSIPILHKAGRGLNFVYDLTYDSSVWY